MIYFIVKQISKLAIRTYYGKISFRNRKEIPKDVPLIILANHTNAFMDSLVLAVFMTRKMKSLPKGVVFLGASKIKTWFFDQIGMIPIFRAIEGSEHLHRNAATFQNCFDVLKKKGCIQVFPEAICVPERRLKPVKKGTSRIVLGAAEANGYELNTNVVFVGMVYEKAWGFKSKLFLNYSRPYDLSQFNQIHKEDKVAGLNAMTKFFGKKIKTQVVHIDNKEDDELVAQVEMVLKPKLFYEYRLHKENPAHDFLLSREIANGINYLRAEKPEQLSDLREKCTVYFSQLKIRKMEDRFVLNSPSYIHLIGQFLILLAGFPFHIYGLLNNYIPAKISKTIADKVVKKIDFYSSVTMLAGICSFLVFYPLMFFLFWFLSDSLFLSLIYAGTLMLSGNFSAFYLLRCHNFMAILKHKKYYQRELKEYEQIKKVRNSLLIDLLGLKSIYKNRHKPHSAD